MAIVFSDIAGRTFTFETPLDLPLGLWTRVPDRKGTVKLLGEVNLWNTLV